MKKIHLLLLSIFSGLLLAVSWPVYGITGLVFIAWLPLLIVENYMHEHRQIFNKSSFFLYANVSMLTWNFANAYWICYAEFTAGIIANVANALLMTTILSLFHFTRKYLNDTLSYISLVAYWIAFEYLHMNWDITWPWLTLGNVFSEKIQWIQWYEYTGHLGGSLWIWVVNILLLKLYTYKKEYQVWNKKWMSLVATIILVPIIFSYVIVYTYTEKNAPLHIAIVQPNIDPYNEKFTTLGEEAQLAKALALASTVIDSTTDYIITPETTLPNNVEEDYIDSSESIITIRKYLKQYPHLKIIMGISTYAFYKKGQIPSYSARKNSVGEYYDFYNTAMQIGSGKNSAIQLYHKSKLVPGAEKMPFPYLLKPLEKLALDLGGTVGSLGIQEERSVFEDKETGTKAAPVICYESVYGEYVGKYVKKGAEFIAIITNDGWWSDSPGYKQHLSYAKLRAIETRRSIVRSANTGISAVIDQRGVVQEHTYWWVDDVLNVTINKNKKLTLYTILGDYIAYISILATFVFMVLLIITKFKHAQ